MPYRLKRKQSIQHNVRRIAHEQIDKALSEIADPELDGHEVVHQVRKRCKKLRGLIRLVRPCFADYKRENAVLRGAAGELAVVRDAQSTLEIFNSLAGHFEAHLGPTLAAATRDRLEQRRQLVAGKNMDLESRLDRFADRMQSLGRRVEKWQVEASGYAALDPGLRKTYRRCRKAMGQAYAKPSPERFHEWRKRTKYHWYHTRLLVSIWPQMLAVHHEAAGQLSDILGDHHDLAVLRRAMLADPDCFGNPDDLAPVLEAIAQRGEQLRQKALPLGQWLFAEKPSRLSGRFKAYWKTWRKSGSRT